MPLDQKLEARLATLTAADARRSPPRVSHREGVHYHLDGRPVTGFCSNDYLGLASLPLPGLPSLPGASASRLICGDLPELRRAEASLATLAGTADAVLFPSGFQLNVGVLPALIEPSDEVFSDRLNHASLIDGLRLARADVRVLPHGAAPPPDRPGAWWITESIFSMDGDRVDLAALDRHRAGGGYVYVDEAHAIGLFDHGRGLLPPAGPADVRIGTLSKAFGVAGAFVAGSQPLCAWIRNRARSYVFSTGPSPRVALDIVRAVERVCSPEGDRLRTRLWSNVGLLRDELGLPGPASSPIVPIVVGPNDATVALGEELAARGWHVQPIRPPTVPEGTARLRVTLSALHEPADIRRFAADVRALFRQANQPLRLGVPS